MLKLFSIIGSAISRNAPAATLAAASMGLAFGQPSAPPPPPPPPAPPGLMAWAGSGSFLGVNAVEIDSNRAKDLKLKEEHGVEITHVEEGSPADKAGIKKGDVVLDYNGQRVEGTEQFVRFVRETPAGRTVTLHVFRNGAPMNISAVVGSRRQKMSKLEMFSGNNWPPQVRMPDVPRPYMGWKSGMLGVEAEGLEGQLAQYFGVKQGVLVRSIIKGSPAEKAGLKAGDVITKVEQTPVGDPRELANALRENQGKKPLSITIVRDRKESAIPATIEDDRGEMDRRSPARRVNREDRE